MDNSHAPSGMKALARRLGQEWVSLGVVGVTVGFDSGGRPEEPPCWRLHAFCLKSTRAREGLPSSVDSYPVYIREVTPVPPKH